MKKTKTEKRFLSWILSFALVLTTIFSNISMFAVPVMAATAELGSSLVTSNLKFDLTDPDGYVTVSFADTGIRPEGAAIDDVELYGTAVGTIIGETQVPFQEGDSVADVTVRLLDAIGVDYDYTGKVEDGFYLAALNDFELNDKYYPTFGEFDAGAQSGWCVRVNNWHINQGSSAVDVEDGDSVKWLYTCQYGADIGADFSTKSAEITGISFTSDAGTLEPAFSTEVSEYTYEVSEDISEIAFEVELENYASVVTMKVDGTEVKYRPKKSISVNKNSKIEISTALEYMDAENNNQTTTYTDAIAIQLKPENSAPVVSESAPTALTAVAGEQITIDFGEFISDADGDTLTYSVKIADLGIDQTLEGSVFTGTIPVAGTYEAVITASDGNESVSHTVTVTVTEADTSNHAPTLKAEFAETKGKTYVYSSSYLYIYMDDIFEDADGDALTYKATVNGEETAVTYNSWSKEYYIQFAEKPVIKEYKIVANDGKADSEVFTAKCIGTTATITVPEDSSLIPGGNYLYYICGSEENDTFALDYSLDVDAELDTEWYSSNTSVLSSNGDGSFTVGNVTSRTQLYVGVTCGKDNWGSPLFLGSKYIYIIPTQPEIADVEIELAEHADNVVATTISNAMTGWYTSEFEYTIENPAICDIAVSGSNGISITPKALGTTTVNAVFKYDESVSCTFDVTVTGRSVQIKDQPGVDSVTFAKDKTVQLEVAGAQEGETFTWTSSNEDVATVDENGLVTVKALGTSYITATSSLSTEEKPVRASMYLQIKENEKVYLDDIAVTDYTYFDGFISPKSGFHSATLEYNWTVNESKYTYKKLAFIPYFDDENLSAVLHYRVSGGEEQTMELSNGTAVSIANGLVGGDNVVTIDVYPKDDEDNVTTYTINIFHPYNPTKTITSMTIYPNGNAALAYPTYEGYKEGTIFHYDKEKEDFVRNTYNNQPVTGWYNSHDTYKIFLYGDRTTEFSLYPTFGYVNERVMIYVNGEPLEEAVTNWKSKTIAVTEDVMTIELRVNSEKYHAAQLAADVEDPFADPESVYTLYVENVSPLGIDAQILSAELDNGEFYQPGFTSNSYNISALIPSDASNTGLTFTVPSGIDVYKTSVSDANKLEAIAQDEDGNNVYKTETLTITGSGFYAYSTTNIILQVTDEENGEIGKAQYAFTVSKRGEKDIYPDSVVEYLCLGSQYTNLSSYGTMPERTLKQNGGILSLGNFGGYIVYKYDTPIENNPNNPYGVDFVIYGNSFGNGGHEPGYVQVSVDGETWYTLAGSDHYEDYNDWNFTMTYTNANGKSAWKNSDGESGEIYNYPLASAYPYFNWTEELEESMTVSGPRLASSAKDAYGSAAAVLPTFGYVDVNTNGTINGNAVNPYNHYGTLASGGDMFDLAWAVDEDGKPVELESISYIRVATASSIYAGAIGEKSTEVTAVNRVTNPSETAVGVTAAPASITVNGEEIAVPANGKTQVVKLAQAAAVDESVDAVLTVEVSAGEDANVYINSDGVSTRSYVTLPEKGIIRIIVQEEEREPYICYLLLNADSDEEENTDEEQNPGTEEEWEAVENIYTTTGKYLVTNVTDPIVNSIGGEWAVLGLARAAYEVPETYYASYVSNLIETLKDKDGVLHKRKYTEYSRVILALSSIGYDVTDVAGYNLLSYLADYDKVVWQGINGPIWALIALDARDYDIPTVEEGKTQTTRESLIACILDQQLEDGGWALSGTVSDADMTAMAIQALAPYYDTNDSVKAAIEEALVTLSKLQGADGYYRDNQGIANAESNAQVVVALTTLGIHPDTDERFVKNEISVLDALCSFYVEGGGFSHTLNGALDGMSTEQGYYALVAYVRMLNGQTTLYDMSDVKNAEFPDVEEPETDGSENDKPGSEESDKDEPETNVPGTDDVISDNTTENSDSTTNTDSSNTSENPKTGDTAPIVPLMAMALWAGTIICVAWKKKNKNA